MTNAHGLFAYPEIVARYVEHQKKPESPLVLPPLRITFIASGYLWTQITGSTSLEATHAVACVASLVTLFVAGVFAWRIAGPGAGLAVFALMAFAPMQIYSAQRALIDGFFALWALLAIWSLWECLQDPTRRGWLAVYGVAIAAMVMTKENAFFVYVAIGGILLASHWLKIGRATLPLYATTIIAPAVAVLVLIVAAGGVTEMLEVYRTNVQKSVISPYAIKTGDGPWHRYLLDLITVDPFIVLLAAGALFNITKATKPALYLGLFIVGTYLLMCQVRYGMNLRYTNIWDMPLRCLAVWQLIRLTSPIPARARHVVLIGMVAALCLLEWQQYELLFVDTPIYDPVPEALGRALGILK